MYQIQHQNFKQIISMKNDNLSSIRNRKYQKPSIVIRKCQLCKKPYTPQNKPVKICIGGHTICELCVITPFFRQERICVDNVQKIKYICPFCSSPLRWIHLLDKHPNLAEGFQIEQINQGIVHRIPESDQQLSLFEKLTQENYKYIMAFLSQKQKTNLASTSMFLRYLLMQAQFWGSFQISDILSMNTNSQHYQQLWKQRLEWIEKYFPIIKPQQLKIMIVKFKVDQTLILFFLNVFPWVTKLSIYCESIQIHLLVAKACPEVTTLIVSSGIFSDELFQKMALSMNKIKHFQVFKDDPNFTAKNLSKRFPEGLQSIVMKVHMIQFQQIAILAKSNPESLTEIELDVEQCQQQSLIDILQSLTNVQVLKLYHMQNIHIPEQISNALSTNVRQLYLSKAYEMPMKQIIQKIAVPKLLTLDFTQVCMLNDQDILLLAKKSPYLRRLNISWSNKVSEQAIAKLIESCLYLQIINLTGVKCLTNKAFRQYDQLLQHFDEQKYDSLKHQISKALSKKQDTQHFQVNTVNFIKNYQNMNDIQKGQILQKIQKIKSLRNAKELNCISCNGVSDKILKFIYLINRKVNTINYYSTEMGLFAYDEIGDQTWY